MPTILGQNRYFNQKKRTEKINVKAGKYKEKL